MEVLYLSGLSFSDVSKLGYKDIVIGIDGEKWIKIFRTKTGVPSNMPILPMAQEILDKYKPDLNDSNPGLLPMYSNQRINSYLKEIGDYCKIEKNLTFHIARHTFATTVTLSNGVPIESVSKMLGHRSLRATQHYAKIIDEKLGADMQTLKNKIGLGISLLKNEFWSKKVLIHIYPKVNQSCRFGTFQHSFNNSTYRFRSNFFPVGFPFSNANPILLATTTLSLLKLCLRVFIMNFQNLLLKNEHHQEVSHL